MLCAVLPARAQSIPDEFRIKREQVFEFAEKPSVARDGDRVTIRFASKGACDATVAIEDRATRIVRHLASGVLGPNATASGRPRWRCTTGGSPWPTSTSTAWPATGRAAG